MNFARYPVIEFLDKAGYSLLVKQKTADWAKKHAMPSGGKEKTERMLQVPASLAEIERAGEVHHE